MKVLRRPSPRTARFLTTLVLSLVVVAVGVLIKPPYVVMRPGPAVDTLGEVNGEAVIAVSGAQTYPTSGRLDFTTVAQYGGPGYEINVWFLLSALIDPSADVINRDELYPQELTAENLRDMNTAQMAGSQNSAEAVVFERLGYQQNAVVATVMPDGPSASTLRPKDRITSVAGTTVERAAQVSQTVQQQPVGTPVDIGIVREGVSSTVQVTPRTIEGRTLIGVGLEAQFPKAPEVEIKVGQVGGPSAGMMFALGLYDKLTPGELTGGAVIAGTGTVALDGEVGPIGGITHKMAGARGDDASWFLAPEKNCPQVVGNVPDGLSVVKVSDFDDALAAVTAIGEGSGASLPTCE